MHSYNAPVRWMGLALAMFGLAVVLTLAAPPMTRAEGGFVDTGIRLPRINWGNASWADYDRDRDLDFAIFGRIPGSGDCTNIYRNDAGSFTDVAASLDLSRFGRVTWGDHDNDGDVDLLVVARQSTLYRNDNSVFDVRTSLTGVELCSIAWGDYDNDGDQDVFFTGTGGWVNHSILANNDHGSFTEHRPNIRFTTTGISMWGDYDGDGDLDMATSGWGARPVCELYRNDAGVFSRAITSFTAQKAVMVAWGDYDNDGDLDLFMTGDRNWADRGYLYRNDSPEFVDTGQSFPLQVEGSAQWGDFDNDGDLDLLVTGASQDMGDDPATHVFRNTGSGFEDWATGMSPSSTASGHWGDYDGDGDLDVLLVGTEYTQVYRNDGAAHNTPPTAPTGLTASSHGARVDFSWAAASDDHTPPQSLTYNLRVGTTPGGCEVMSPMAAADGWRYLPAMGNAQLGTAAWLSLPMGIYYWSVQAIDGAYIGGPFAEEGMFTVGPYVQVALTDARDTWYAGWNWDYQITVTRTVPLSDAHVLVTDTLPAGVYPIAIPEGAVQNADGSITWDLSDLATGAARTLRLWVRAFTTLRGPVTNRVMASCADEPPQTAEDTTIIIAPPAPTATVTATATSTPTPISTLPPNTVEPPTLPAPAGVWLPAILK